MKKSAFSKQLFRAMSFVVLGIALFAFKAKAGADGIEVYLNNKLILKQYLTRPLDLKAIPLDKSNIKDKLVFYFTQCNVIGKTAKGRSIVVRDEKGNKLKEWKFDDAKDSSPAMVIEVKDLLQLENGPGDKNLSLYYTAEGHPEAQIITSLKIISKAV
jgi:hypothetical protein